jgi:hypothetical protein
VTERMNMQFRWENYNIFNRTNLGLPNSSFDAGAAAGTITDINENEPMRNMQFALRLTF